MAQKLSIRKGGAVYAICSEESVKLLETLGNISIKRASHVEPGSGLTSDAKSYLHRMHIDANNFQNKWFANLLPIAGPVLGPFNTRTEAVTAELNYIDKNLGTIIHD